MATCDTDLPQQYVGRRGIRCTWHGESFLPGFRFRSHGLETRLYNRTTPYMDCTHMDHGHHDINHQITYPKQQEGLTVCIRYPRLGSTDPKCSVFSLDAQLRV